MTDITNRDDLLERRLAILSLAICTGLVAYKGFLTSRINVNWDEFYFLTFVHEFVRGEMTAVMQSAYTRLFVWLPYLPGDEIAEIVVARLVMVILLGVSAFLVWKLARLWLSPFASALSLLAYLGIRPVMLHGGSFRADSLLLPLSAGCLWLLARQDATRRTDLIAGCIFGLAFVVTVKAVLFLPLVVALVLFRRPEDRWSAALVRAIPALGMVGAAAATVALVLLGLHAAGLPSASAESVAGFAGRVANKTLLDTHWFPRREFLLAYIKWQPLPWLLMGLGFGVAVFKRRLQVASLALSMLPIAFYRNAFPYYYVVMLAPSCVLAGYAVQQLGDTMRRMQAGSGRPLLLAAVWLGLVYQGVLPGYRLSHDTQAIQRQIVAGVHEIFVDPVPYVDRCGMIASFKKTNFFMSTWGMETYLSAARPFMPEAIRGLQPAFVLVNTAYLNPVYGALLPEDVETIDRFYPVYWGPVRVAGGSTVLHGQDLAHIEVPFTERYRIFAGGNVLVDGVLRAPGEIVEVPRGGVSAQWPPDTEVPNDATVTLFLASARPPPQVMLPNMPIFELL